MKYNRKRGGKYVPTKCQNLFKYNKFLVYLLAEFRKIFVKLTRIREPEIKPFVYANFWLDGNFIFQSSHDAEHRLPHPPKPKPQGPNLIPNPSQKFSNIHPS